MDVYLERASTMLDEISDTIDSRINDIMIDIDGSVPGVNESFSIRLLAPNEEMKFLRPKGGTTVGELKEIVHAKTGVPPERQRLVLGGKILSDSSRTLRSYSMTPASTIHLFPRPAPLGQIPPSSAPTKTNTPLQAEQPVTSPTESLPIDVNDASNVENKILAKYLMLINIGVSRTTVLEKMRTDGVDPSLLPNPEVLESLTPSNDEQSTRPNPTPPLEVDSIPPTIPTDLSDSPEASWAATPFLSPPTISESEETPSLFDGSDGDPFSDEFDAPPPSSRESPVNSSPPSPSLSRSIELQAPSPMAKYELMVSIGLSLSVVKAKMILDGVSTESIDSFLSESYHEEGNSNLGTTEEEEGDPCQESLLESMMEAEQEWSLEADIRHLDALISHAADVERKRIQNSNKEQARTEEEEEVMDPKVSEDHVRSKGEVFTAENPNVHNVAVDEWGRLPGPPQLMIMNSFTCPVCLAEGKLEVSFAGQEALIDHYSREHCPSSAPTNFLVSNESSDPQNMAESDSKSWITMFDGKASEQETTRQGKYLFSSQSDDESQKRDSAAEVDVVPNHVRGDGDQAPLDWVLTALGLHVTPSLPQVTES